MLKQAMVKTGAIFAALTVVALAAPAHAEPPMESQQPVVVVTDFSGSMNEADADEAGTTRIAAAKAAVKNLLAEAPDGSRLGLVAYGANNDSCGDIETVHPVGEFDAAELGARVDALEAKGNTPIGPALKHAAKDLASIEGPRSIVLVSDGEPNCEPPPACDVAKELAAQGIDMTVHTIGFRLAGNAKAQETLQCIADSTGGEYTHVETSGDLKRVLETETKRAMEGYEAEGTPVEGGPVASKSEPLIAGQYVTKLVTGDRVIPTEGSGETEHPNQKWFSVPHHDGWDVNVAATLVAPPGNAALANDEYRRIQLFEYGPGGRCGLRSDFAYEDGVVNGADTTTTMVMSAAAEPAECITPDGKRVFSVFRSDPGWAEHELDVELLVTYTRVTETPQPASDAGYGDVGVPERSEPVAMSGGSSFNNATELKPGQTISDTVVHAERRYFTLPVGYGQNMRMRLEFQEPEPSPREVRVEALNPLRQQMHFADGEHAQGFGQLRQVGLGGTALAPMNSALVGPILPGNVLGDDDAKVHAYPGRQYLVISNQNNQGVHDVPLPFELTLDTVGDAFEGGVEMVMDAKDYAAAFGADEATGDPVGEQSGAADDSPSTEPSSSSEAAGQPTSQQDEEQEEQSAEASSDGGAFPWVPALGGAGALLVAGGGAWYGLRRRG